MTPASCGGPRRVADLERRAAARTRRAPYTRSGRTATTLPTTRPVITASPMPISTCHADHRGQRACRAGCRRVPPTAYSPTKTSAATGTETNAASRPRRRRPARAAWAAPPGAAGRPASRRRRVTRPISMMLVPSAVMPPSAKSRPARAAPRSGRARRSTARPAPRRARRRAGGRWCRRRPGS